MVLFELGRAIQSDATQVTKLSISASQVLGTALSLFVGLVRWGRSACASVGSEDSERKVFDMPSTDALR